MTATGGNRDQQDDSAGSIERIARRFALIQEETDVCLWERDLVSGEHYWSRGAYLLYGWPLDRGPPSYAEWLAMIHPDDRVRAAGLRKDPAALRGGFENELRIVRPDGGVRWVLNRAKADLGPDGRALRFYGVNIDITERKHAETALRESETRFRLIADSAPVPMWVTTLDRRRSFVNRAYLEFLGCTYEDAVDFDWRQVLHPDDVDRIRREQIEKEASLRPFVLEARYRTATGGSCWLRSYSQPRWGPDGAHIGFIGVAFDVTIAKEAELELKRQVAERTAELEALYNRTPTMLQSLNAEGRLVSVSDRWLEFMGFDTRDEVLGRPIAEFATPESVAHFREHDWPTLLAGGEVKDSPYQSLKKSGEVADVLISSRVWHDAAGQFARTMGVIVDVTGKKRTEDALRQAQKVEAMGQLTGGVAHDFNNLLSPIIGGLDLLQRRQVGNARDQRIIAGALQAAERAKTLVQRLLAFARRQPLQPASVDAGKLIEGMADLIASTVGPRVRVAIDVADDLPACLVDPNQVEMALLNLSVNARDAMPDGGILTVAASAQTIVDAVDDLTPGGYVRLSVSDTGHGMDAATLARAIEPFFSTKGVGRGTGLGLSMVHGLAAQLGGALRIDSAPGEGTDVQLWLPFTAERPRIAGESPSQTVGPVGSGTALLVDDEALVRASTAEMLADMGFAVIECASADEAMVRLRADPVDLIVTDHLMPGMSGTELAAAVRLLWPEVPVLLISGYAEAEGVDPDLPRLTKPFRHADLASMLATIIR